MSTVVADMSMSLDGFVADPSDDVGRVFSWYSKPQPQRSTSEPNGPGLGLIVYGRRTFEVARGWGGNHPLGVAVIVVTHSVPDGWPREDSTVSFVTAGIESAIEQAKASAGDKVVAIGSPSITQQCLNLGAARQNSSQPRAGVPRRGHPLLREPDERADRSRWADRVRG
jgi:dihydrofolate reductase